MRIYLIPEILRRLLLFCGMAAAILTIATDIVAGLCTNNYHFLSQSANLLSAARAPTRPYVLPLNLTANVLMIAFSLGLWFSPHPHWAMRVTAGLILASALLSSVAAAFFPIHPELSYKDYPNNINVIVMGVGVLCFFLAIIFSVIGHNNWFRYFSIGLLVLFLLEDIIATRGTQPSLDGSPGPLVGLQERTMIYGEMFWMALQALLLL